jgi:hypothetical protein
MGYTPALWWDEVGTSVPFSDIPIRLTFRIEQFWGRAARASRIRENPDARLIFRKDLTPVPPHPLASRQNVPFHRALYVAFAGARGQLQFDAQSI